MIRHELSWMDDRVLAGTLHELSAAWQDTPPAWIGELPKDESRLDVLQHRLSELLNGVPNDKRELMYAELAEWYRELPMTVDQLEFDLARRTGTDMLAALCIARVQQRRQSNPAYCGFQITRGPAKRAKLSFTIDVNHIQIRVPLSAEAVWAEDELIIQRVLPNAYQIAVLDKPLSSVVSHPLLDPHGLVIENIEIVRERETRLKTNYRDATVGLIEIRHDDMRSDEGALDGNPPSRKAAASHLSSPF